LAGVRKKLKNNPKGSERQSKVVLRLKKIKEELKELGKAMDEVSK
jgi:chaperonin cofactor prefoldin